MTGITADYDTLLRQASMTAHDYMMNAKSDIDEMFGAGYAAKHPELVAAYMQTAARDLHTSTIAKEIGGAIETLAEQIGSAASELPSFDGIAEAIQNIAGMLDLYSCGRPSKISAEQVEP
jgi:hypothetical protein